jgi:hypothetical protein
MKRVIIESPYGGDNKISNIQYACAAMADCLKRGEAPFASHLLYTHDGILDDDIPHQRALGIEAGLQWGRFADATIVYQDYGITKGMKIGIERAKAEKRPIEYRNIKINIS